MLSFFSFFFYMMGILFVAPELDMMVFLLIGVLFNVFFFGFARKSSLKKLHIPNSMRMDYISTFYPMQFPISCFG